MLKRSICLAPLIIIFCSLANLTAQVPEKMIDQRAAIERVYFDHRTGTKNTFEEILPRELIEELVQSDMAKERVLREVYGITITDAQIEAEMRRIDRSTRAPEVLAEIKSALANDPEQIGQMLVKPILVDSELRRRFANDNTLHAKQRNQGTMARNEAIDSRGAGLDDQRKALDQGSGSLREIKWRMHSRPEAEAEAPRITGGTPPKTKESLSGGRYAIEATAQVAQVISSPEQADVESDPEFYFDDLHPDLKRVLDIQLQNPGDVSALVEQPGNFQVFLLEERNPDEIRVTVLSIQKRSYEEWLGSQPQM